MRASLANPTEHTKLVCAAGCELDYRLVQFELAQLQGLCLIDWRNVDKQRTSPGCRPTAKSALAGLLAILFLLATTVSVTHSLHHSLPGNHSAGSHSCFLCAFAKGQVASADTAPIAAFLALCLVSTVHLAKVSAPANWDYRFSPSRAPPLLSSKSHA